MNDEEQTDDERVAEAEFLIREALAVLDVDGLIPAKVRRHLERALEDLAEDDEVTDPPMPADATAHHR